MKTAVSYINRNRIFQEFKHLVGIDSESYHEREMADYLLAKLMELGLAPVEDGAGKLLQEKSKVADSELTGNLFVRLPGNLEDKKRNRENAILFSAHMDTVSPGVGKKLIRNEDGRITSDGTTVLGADDLAGVAAILELLAVLKENGLRYPDIEVLFTVAEEPYAQGSRVFDYSGIEAKQAYVLDYNGEIGSAVTAAPSIISFQIRVKGKSAHAGFEPEAGIHAIQIAAAALQNVPMGHVGEGTTVNIGTIQGGTARNIVPDEVILQGEIRSMLQEEALRQVKNIESVFREEAEKYLRENYKREKDSAGSIDSGSHAEDIIELHFTEELTAYRIDADEKSAKDFVSAAEALGLRPVLTDTFGGSDNNHFARSGIRGLVTACGMHKVHSKQEYTSLDEIVNSAALILQIVMQAGR